MRKTITRGLAVAAALAAATVGLVTTNASAYTAPATAPFGVPTLSPTSGSSSTTFTLSPAAGAACQGDSASGGYKVSSFVVANTVDPSTLTYTSTGPNGTGNTPIYDTTGTPFVAKNTAVTTGFLTGLPNINFATVTPAAGKYWIGYACTLAGATTRYWATNITVDGSGNFSFGWAPEAPVLASPLTAHHAELDGTFTVVQVPQAITGYTVTATPTSGSPVTANLAANATSFQLTGLTDGTQYAVKVTATNSVGNTDSNSVNGTPAPDACPAPSFSLVPGSSKLTVNWTAPSCAVSGNPAIQGYTINWSDTTTPASGSVSPAAADVTADITGLTPGDTISVTITANYSGLYTGTTAGAQTAVPLSAAVLVQDVAVTRPVGALVMTQVCGANGAIAARAATAEFPIALTSIAANGTGTAPTYNGVADTNFANYPYPVDNTGAPAAVYPTHCGLDLGTASLITKDQVNPTLGATGNLAGQYFLASGKLSQITVVDTRDVDAGWTINASMSAFTKQGVVSPNSKQTFSGNHLGWNPQVTNFSGNTFGEYAMQVTAGSAVAPMNTGLGTSKSLASAAASHGLGEAQLDARVELLVPVWAVSGIYQGTLTFSAL